MSLLVLFANLVWLVRIILSLISSIDNSVRARDHSTGREWFYRICELSAYLGTKKKNDTTTNNPQNISGLTINFSTVMNSLRRLFYREIVLRFPSPKGYVKALFPKLYEHIFIILDAPFFSLLSRLCRATFCYWGSVF